MIRKIVLVLFLILCILILMGCVKMPRDNGFDIETEGIVDVIVIAHSSIMSGREETEIRYYSLANHQRIRLTEEFESDQMTIYTVPDACFESYSVKPIIGPGKLLNRLVYMELVDEEQHSVPVNDEQSRIFQHLAGLEHVLRNIRFFEMSGETFIYLELDVNLWTPCYLYWYDREIDALILLHEWDDEEVVGLHLRNITLAR